MTKWKSKKKLKITDSSKKVKPFHKKNNPDNVKNSKSTSQENRRGSGGKVKEGFKSNPKKKSFKKKRYEEKEDEGEEELEVVRNKQQQTSLQTVQVGCFFFKANTSLSGAVCILTPNILISHMTNMSYGKKYRYL